MPLTKITNTGLADDAVTSDKVADGVISAADVADGTLTNAKLANSDITINGTSIALGASGEIVAGTDWQAVTVADGSTTVNATAGQGYFLDTNAGVIEVFLPTSPTQGDTVILVDYAGTFATNNVIVNTGGVAIDSTVGSDFILSTNNRIAEFVYVDSNKGWLYKGATTRGSTPSQAGVPVYDTDPAYISATGGTITTSGDFKIHTFTGDGCFVVSTLGSGVPCAVASTVDYLVVAGGGAGAKGHGGGGGAGGFRESKDSTLSSPHTASPLAATTGLTVSATTYPVTIGAGGAGAPATGDCSPYVQTSGSNSVFSTITSAGGGKGGGWCSQAGANGGSGGGGGGPGSPTTTGYSGNTPPTSPPQGNNGGNGTSPGGGGGGGGATTTGGNSTSPGPNANGGPGGTGATTSISGSPTAYAGGGGGGNYFSPGVGGTGGTGGGGSGSNTPADDAQAGTANTGGGGGGGGANYTKGAGGGKGIVVIRYKFQ